MSGPEQSSFDRLLDVARAGDRPALGLLIVRFRSYLVLLARLRIGRNLQGKLDPEDLLQEVSLQAQKNIGRFVGTTEAEFLAWLRAILAAIVCNHIRRYFGTRRRDPRREQQMVVELDETSRALDRNLIAQLTSPSQHAARREQAVLLADALETLPEAHREVLILRHLEGLTFPEVARRLARSEDSVKNLWARGLARLRQSMKEQP
jgi:RNA polymerase sigma-70 factor (ECF subfamily)